MSGVTPERVRELLKGCTPGEWAYFYKRKYGEHHVSVPLKDGSGFTLGLFPDGVPTARPEADGQLIALAPELARAYLAERIVSSALEVRIDDLTLERDRLAHELRLLREAVECAPVSSGQVRAELVRLPEPIRGVAQGQGHDQDEHPHQHGCARRQRAGWETVDEDRHTHAQPKPSQPDHNGSQQRCAGDHHRDHETTEHASPQRSGDGLPPEFVGDVGLLEEHGAVLTRASLSDDTPERSGGEG